MVGSRILNDDKDRLSFIKIFEVTVPSDHRLFHPIRATRLMTHVEQSGRLFVPNWRTKVDIGTRPHCSYYRNVKDRLVGVIE